MVQCLFFTLASKFAASQPHSQPTSILIEHALIYGLTAERSRQSCICTAKFLLNTLRCLSYDMSTHAATVMTVMLDCSSPLPTFRRQVYAGRRGLWAALNRAIASWPLRGGLVTVGRGDGGSSHLYSSPFAVVSKQSTAVLCFHMQAIFTSVIWAGGARSRCECIPRCDAYLGCLQQSANVIPSSTVSAGHLHISDLCHAVPADPHCPGRHQ